ncbi:helix-turn-helix domain-containing protein [Roseovarius sp. ZX-A-9]|uniref:helix-turn-helix domain-containing protein n=1 Tax=Roseovarius sp. ZX-A-9 TaxID=3014783 RepID=UPI00232AFA79|nr:helix-turn-helix transcriptional regulator [Roseovarius sp. ZX-A-9]
MRAPIGIRVRRQRIQKKQTQAGLARAVGISPSYLNLIENNKRDIGGRLLMNIAEQLGIEVDELSGGPEQRTLNALQEVLNDPLLHGIGLEQADLHDLVARFPEVARALTRLHAVYGDATAELEANANRLSSDPILSEMLHEVVSRITAMRSSAEILSQVKNLAPKDERRFSEAITREARSLSTTVRNLASYFDLSSSRRRSISPMREVEDAIINSNNHYPELEELAKDLRTEILKDGEFGEVALSQALQRRFGVSCQRWHGHSPPPPQGKYSNRRAHYDEDGKVLWLRTSSTAATRQFQMARLYARLAGTDLIEKVCSGFELTTDEAQLLAQGALASYVAGALVMPYDGFLEDAAKNRYDIDLLSHIYSASFEQVAHRLVTLRRKGAEGLPFGFLRADMAGRLTKRFPLPGLSLPGTGHGCLLWPIYNVAGTPRVVRQISEFSNGARFLMIAKSVKKRLSAWNDQPLMFSVMLACDLVHADRTVYGHGLDLDDAATRVPVGPSCLLCVREGCSHRQEAVSAMMEAQTG